MWRKAYLVILRTHPRRIPLTAMVQARCGRTGRWDTALTSAENSAVLSFKHGIKVYVTDVESSLQQKPWRLRSQSCPRGPDQGHPRCMKSPNSSSAVVIGQGLHPFNSCFPAPVFLLNSLRKKCSYISIQNLFLLAINTIYAITEKQMF